ncbi:putative porin [Pontibacter chitinilyticus]|uniref:putative porin n=1 Tax=Pontibacter chitinilyticus TaxID=2674989 RepID=UPI00321C0316
MKRKLFAILLFLFGLISLRNAHAQIIDDSTKVIYSPKTTLHLYENDVLEGRYVEERIDTTIQNFQNERYWYHDTAYYQQLGNVGTAAQPLLYRLPGTIGIRFGRNAFDRYAYDPQNINYYNTRSPYSHLFYVQGGQGEQLFEAIHARNITPRWNIGAAYQLLAAQKQLNTVASTGTDRLIDHSGAKLFTHYRSKNDNYDLFLNFTLLHVAQIEQGGVLVPSATTPRDSLFNYQTQSVNLQQAETQEKRNHLHVLQVYKIAAENLKAYHMLDIHTQKDEFMDDELPRIISTNKDTTVLFYPTTYYSKAKTDDEANYREMQNVFGLTGNNKLSSYKAYAKFRNAKIDYSAVEKFASGDSIPRRTITADQAYNQLFVGGQLRLFYENKAELAVDGEFQLSRDYRLRGIARLGGLQASLERILYSPSATQQFMLSNHFFWNPDDFKSSVADHGEVAYNGKLGERQYVKLKAHYTNIKRYIFYNTLAKPEQLSGNQRLWGAEISHQIHFGGFHFDNFVAYTNTDEADRIRVPEWLLDSKLYFQGFLFKQALYGQFGVEAYLPTGYYADAYMPVTQQFYQQNTFKLDTYPVIDVFITADIKTLNVFLKMSHVNDTLWKPGYFATPYYPGMRRSFMFGVKWMFFD